MAAAAAAEPVATKLRPQELRRVMANPGLRRAVRKKPALTFKQFVDYHAAQETGLPDNPILAAGVLSTLTPNVFDQVSRDPRFRGMDALPGIFARRVGAEIRRSGRAMVGPDAHKVVYTDGVVRATKALRKHEVLTAWPCDVVEIASGTMALMDRLPRDVDLFTAAIAQGMDYCADPYGVVNTIAGTPEMTPRPWALGAVIREAAAIPATMKWVVGDLEETPPLSELPLFLHPVAVHGATREATIAAMRCYDQMVARRCNAGIATCSTGKHGCIVIKALRDIAPGEELFVGRGLRWWAPRLLPRDLATAVGKKCCEVADEHVQAIGPREQKCLLERTMCFGVKTVLSVSKSAERQRAERQRARANDPPLIRAVRKHLLGTLRDADGNVPLLVSEEYVGSA